MVFTKIKSSTSVFNINNQKMFLEQQIMISEGSYDTDDYEVMMLTIQLCITEINYILKYIQIDKFFSIIIIFKR